MAEPLKALEADATAGQPDPEGVVVRLVTDDAELDMPILHATMWYEGAAEDLTFGRITDWVHKACDDAEALTAWDGLRKRYRDLDSFVKEWSRLTGEDSGKSPASERSSRSTRKR